MARQLRRLQHGFACRFTKLFFILLVPQVYLHVVTLELPNLFLQDKQGRLYGIFTIDLRVFRCEVLFRRLAASRAVRALRGWVGRVAQSVWSRCSCESQGARLPLPESLRLITGVDCLTLPSRRGW